MEQKMNYRFVKVEKVNDKGWYLVNGNWKNPLMYDVYLLEKESDGDLL